VLRFFVLGGLVVLGIHDVVQKRHSILRSDPVLGHLRFLLEGIRPELLAQPPATWRLDWAVADPDAFRP
jgi:hypothetical protein